MGVGVEKRGWGWSKRENGGVSMGVEERGGGGGVSVGVEERGGGGGVSVKVAVSLSMDE